MTADPATDEIWLVRSYFVDPQPKTQAFSLVLSAFACGFAFPTIWLIHGDFSGSS